MNKLEIKISNILATDDHYLNQLKRIMAEIEDYNNVSEIKEIEPKNYLFKVKCKATDVEVKVYGIIGSTFLVWSNDNNKFIQIFYDEFKSIEE